MIVSYNVPSAGRTIVETSSGKSYAITAGFFCNIDSSSTEILNLHLVPNGQLPSSSNKIIHELHIAQGDTFTFDTERIILEGGDALYAASSKGNIAATISIMEL